MQHYCTKCQRDTAHSEHFQEKPNRYSQSFWGGVKRTVWETFVIGGSTDMALKRLDELDRVVECKACSHKEIANEGENLQ